MFFNGRRWVSLVRGCVGRAVRGRRSRRSGTAWWLERLENRIVPALITVTSVEDVIANDGLVTLREAIQAANTDMSVNGSTAGSGADTIQFAAGLAGQTITLGGTQLDINSDLTINGLGASQLTISADNLSRIFVIQSQASVTISGLTLTNGAADGSGGAIVNDGALIINNCTISGNSATLNGGGVSSSSFGNIVTLTIYNSTISGNSATLNGGGVSSSSVGSSVTLTIYNSTISGNTATGDGGGIYNKDDSTLTIHNSTISSNYATDEGGGIQNRGTLMINGGTISGNTANGGGGISQRGGTLTINNSTVSGNSANYFGGGVYNFSTLTINNSTISGNSATINGGGIFNADNSTLTIHNSTISGNSATRRGGGICNAVSTLTIHNSTISGNSATAEGGGIFNADYSTLTIHNSTISENSATNGGGIFNTDDATVGLRSTIVANNDAVDAGDDLRGPFRVEFSLIECRPGFTVVETVPGSNRYGVDPLLGPLAENGGPTLTHALLPGSPAINRGSNPVPQSFDARGLGYVRAVGRTDIGAFEVQQKGSYLVSDLINPAKQQLIVVGSALSDKISLAFASGKLSVTFNGRIQKFSAANLVGIVVRGNDGDDTITLASSVLIGGLLDGGSGDDVLTGSVGNDLLLGGEGDDKLLGLGGKDVLIGGDGHDSLTGGNGDDLLIGGATLYDNSPTALLAIATAWTDAKTDYATRTKILREGLNATPPLNASTIFDGFYDELTADTGATGGLELLFHDILDQLTGVTSPEQAVLVQ